MVAKSGVATRPQGSDSFPPVAGSRVSWVLAPILVRLAEQAERIGWTVYSIGNADHLKKHGDHTPWSAGKSRGIVYAIDVMIPDALLPAFKVWFLAYCKSNADTTWIDFFNLAGSQYDFAGRRVASSSDHHLHLSVNRGHENKISDLFDKWRTRNNPPAPPKPAPTNPATPEKRKDNSVFLIRTSDGAVYKTDGFKAEHIPGPSSREGYKDLVRALGDPTDIKSDGADFGVPQKKENK